jgi:hypothetical protein
MTTKPAMVWHTQLTPVSRLTLPYHDPPCELLYLLTLNHSASILMPCTNMHRSTSQPSIPMRDPGGPPAILASLLAQLRMVLSNNPAALNHNTTCRFDAKP